MKPAGTFFAEIPIFMSGHKVFHKFRDDRFNNSIVATSKLRENQTEKTKMTTLLLSFLPYGETMQSTISSFRYKYNETPITNWVFPAVSCVAYLLSLYFLPLYMRTVRKNQPIKNVVLDTFIKFHNLFLSVLSAIMVFGFVSEAANVWIENRDQPVLEQISSVTCDESNRMGSGATPFWLYIFYLSKYYEFLDTVFLMVKCKKLTFLHTFHHVSTLLLCWYVMLEKAQMMWIPSALNAGVHVIMYFYFYVCMLKNSSIFTPSCLEFVKPWITRMQILQFVADLVIPKVWLWFKYGEGKECSGNYYAFSLVDIIVGSFLILFLNFYFKSYGKKESTPKHSKSD